MTGDTWRPVAEPALGKTPGVLIDLLLLDTRWPLSNTHTPADSTLYTRDTSRSLLPG